MRNIEELLDKMQEAISRQVDALLRIQQLLAGMSLTKFPDDLEAVKGLVKGNGEFILAIEELKTHSKLFTLLANELLDDHKGEARLYSERIMNLVGIFRAVYPQHVMLERIVDRHNVH